MRFIVFTGSNATSIEEQKDFSYWSITFNRFTKQKLLRFSLEAEGRSQELLNFFFDNWLCTRCGMQSIALNVRLRRCYFIKIEISKAYFSTKVWSKITLETSMFEPSKIIKQWCQNGVKIHQNAFQNKFRFLNRFFMDFDLQKHAPDLAKVWFSYRFL